MKIILSESQYNRLFNNKKRKLVITENQYEKLLFEANLKGDFNKIQQYDIIKLNKKEKNGNITTLHFRVKSIATGKGLIMINCNDGVYKNTYFYITNNDYNGADLNYMSAQEKNIETKIGDDGDPWETINDTNLWRKSIFKNISSIDVYNDGGKQDCNLSNQAEKRFTISTEETEFSDKQVKDLMNNDKKMKDLIQNNPGDWLEFLGLARKKGIVPSRKIFQKWGASPMSKGPLTNFKKDKTIKVQFIGEVEKANGADLVLLKEMVDAIKSIGNKTNLRVSRNYNGEQYLKLNGKLRLTKGDTFYTLRISGNASGEDDKYKATIVLKDKTTNRDSILGKVEIKVLDYDTEKL